jgi:hypothetical protein
MKSSGMHYLIIGPVVECTPGEPAKTLYPSSLPNTVLESALNGQDMVDRCLRNAESAGIKVFIGISFNDLWWNAHGSDTTWLYNQMAFDNTVCDELWTLYKSKYPEAFYGWYWSYEVDNVSFVSAAQQAELIHAMNLQLDHLTSANIKLPFMWCPFMNSKLGTAQAYETFWENVFAALHTTAGDIFCPQDGVGAGGLKLSEVAGWFSVLRQAADTKAGLLMWSDVETFIESDWTAATMDRFVAQMDSETPYVDNSITFAYCHYYSPYNTDPGFQSTYLNYLNTGYLETSPPTAPGSLTATAQGNGDVLLNWAPSTDDIGVCGYYCYRNGKLIWKEQVPRLDGASQKPPLATSFTDNALSPSTKYAYVVRAYDFAGNLSDSSLASVTTASVQVLSVGCPYAVSRAPSNTYPDPGGKKLTDGKFASVAYYADPAWVGYLNADGLVDTLNVVIDLGHIAPVQHFSADYLLDPQPAVYLPKQVNTSVSTDNDAFTDAGVLVDNAANDSTSSVHNFSCTLSSPVNARYVKFKTIAPGNSWVFVDEYEVLGSVTSSIRPQPSLASATFDLSNNYPNPFNPSTTITVRLPVSGMMSLKFYGLLGQVVKVVDQGVKSAGEYVYHVIMDNAASGVYFYTLQQGPHVMTKKMTLVK